MKKGNDLLLFSLMFSMNEVEDHDITWLDLRYSHVAKVSKCLQKIYSMVIELLSKGMSYEQIYSFIDNVDISEFKEIDNDAKNYVKTRVKKDLISRENNEKNKRGAIR